MKLVLAGGRYLPERVEALAFGSAEPATAPLRADALTGSRGWLMSSSLSTSKPAGCP